MINKKNVPVVANNVIQVPDYVGRNVAQENFKNWLGIQIEDNDSIQGEDSMQEQICRRDACDNEGDSIVDELLISNR